MRTKFRLFILSIFAMVLLFSVNVFASAPTDEIVNYEITVDINSDATATITYHIDWLVLESDEAGPVSWVEVGIPNKHCESYIALSDNIDNINTNFSGTSTLKIYFDDKYYEGDVISFDFQIVQNNLYRVNKFNEGYTVYTFTPGWFDEIDVDNLVIKWNSDNIDSWSPDCIVDAGYNTFTTSLSAGERYTVDITYPNDAYGFDLTMDPDAEPEQTIGEKIGTAIGSVIIIILGLLFMASPLLIIGGIVYAATKGFGRSYTEKYTRTKIEYYSDCEGCGAPRQEGEKFCTYCGRSMIKSEEIVKEEDVPSEIKKLKTNGEYKLSSLPNTYYRINVVRTPIVTHSSGHHSSGHHSSCAHSSCACACACACAGGGRAGCTNKDFYKTELKMKHINKAVKD